MGSLYDKETGSQAVFQCVFAQWVINDFLTKLYRPNDPDPQKSWKSAIVFDSSFWIHKTKQENFIKKKFL
jgi:hypothetical protein